MSGVRHFLTQRDQWKDLVASQKLSAIALRLALVLSSRFNEREDGCAFVAIDTAAALMAVSRSSAKRALRELHASGLLGVTVRRGHSTNLFSMRFEPVDCPKRQAIMLNPLSEQETVQNSGVLSRETVQHREPLIVSDQLGGPPMGPPDSWHTSTLTSEVVEVEIVSPSPNAAPRAAGEGFATNVIVAPVEPSRVDAVGSIPSSAEPVPSPEADEVDEEPTLDERLEALRVDVLDLVDQGIAIPDELADFLERDQDLDEDELATLEDLARDAFEEDRERAAQADAEIEAAQAAVAARRALPLSERINDPDHRAGYVDRLATYLVTLDREQRWASSRRYRAKIVEELKITLPRFKAEALAQDLADEVSTEVWRRERSAVPDEAVADRAARSLGIHLASSVSTAQELRHVER